MAVARGLAIVDAEEVAARPMTGRNPSHHKRRKPMLRVMLFAAAVVSGIPFWAAAQGVPDFAAIIAAPDRSEADRATDRRRDPVKLFGFTGVRLGMTVLDMGAGGGYSTELIA